MTLDAPKHDEQGIDHAIDHRIGDDGEQLDDCQSIVRSFPINTWAKQAVILVCLLGMPAC